MDLTKYQRTTAGVRNKTASQQHQEQSNNNDNDGTKSNWKSVLLPASSGPKKKKGKKKTGGGTTTKSKTSTTTASKSTTTTAATTETTATTTETAAAPTSPTAPSNNNNNNINNKKKDEWTSRVRVPDANANQKKRKAVSVANAPNLSNFMKATPEVKAKARAEVIKARKLKREEQRKKLEALHAQTQTKTAKREFLTYEQSNKGWTKPLQGRAKPGKKVHEPKTENDVPTSKTKTKTKTSTSATKKVTKSPTSAVTTTTAKVTSPKKKLTTTTKDGSSPASRKSFEVREPFISSPKSTKPKLNSQQEKAKSAITAIKPAVESNEEPKPTVIEKKVQPKPAAEKVQQPKSTFTTKKEEPKPASTVTKEEEEQPKPQSKPEPVTKQLEKQGPVVEAPVRSSVRDMIAKANKSKDPTNTSFFNAKSRDEPKPQLKTESKIEPTVPAPSPSPPPPVEQPKKSWQSPKKEEEIKPTVKKAWPPSKHEEEATPTPTVVSKKVWPPPKKEEPQQTPTPSLPKAQDPSPPPIQEDPKVDTKSSPAKEVVEPTEPTATTAVVKNEPQVTEKDDEPQKQEKEAIQQEEEQMEELVDDDDDDDNVDDDDIDIDDMDEDVSHHVPSVYDEPEDFEPSNFAADEKDKEEQPKQLLLEFDFADADGNNQTSAVPVQVYSLDDISSVGSLPSVYSDDSYETRMNKLMQRWVEVNENEEEEEEEWEEDYGDDDFALDDNVLDHIILGASDLDTAMQLFEQMTGIQPTINGPLQGLGAIPAHVTLEDNRYIEILAPDPDVDGPLGNDLLKLEPGVLVPFHYSIRSREMSRLVAGYVSDVLGWEPDHIAMVQAFPDGTLMSYDILTMYGHGIGGVAPSYIKWKYADDHPTSYIDVTASLERCTVRAPSDHNVHKLVTDIDGIDVEFGEPLLEISLATPKGKVTFSSKEPRGLVFPGYDDVSRSSGLPELQDVDSGDGEVSTSSEES